MARKKLAIKRSRITNYKILQKINLMLNLQKQEFILIFIPI